MIKPDVCFCDALLLGNYVCVFRSPSSLYENGSNLDLRLQGYELRGQMKGRGVQKKKKVEESQGRNSIHLTPFPILNFKKTCKREYIKIVRYSWDLNGSE